MSVNIQYVNLASESLLDASASLVVSLMKDDVTLLSLCGGDPGLFFPMARAMVAACALEGEYYTATNADGELLGFSCWMPPGKQIFSTEAQRQLGFNDFMERLPAAGKEYHRTTYFVEFPSFVAKCLGSPKWKADFWWLHTLMVRPESHRQGVARALLRPVREKATRAREPLALSTTTQLNVTIYQALGFTLLGDRTVPSPWGDWPLYVLELRPEDP